MADSTSPSKVRCVAYIDGFNLYFGMKDAGFDRYFWLDVVAFANSLCKIEQQIVVTKYFTSRITGAIAGDDAATMKRRNEKRRKQKIYLDALSTPRD